LRGEIKVMLRQDSPRPVRPAERQADRRGSAPIAGPVAGPVSQPVFEALRAWRAAEAKMQSVPPYVIFHDSVLRDIAAVRPDSLDVLARIKGVGVSKLERYGAAVLEVLNG